MAQYGQQHHFADEKDTMHSLNRMGSDMMYGAPQPQNAIRQAPMDRNGHGSIPDANSILTNNDSHLMNTFFDDPNNFSVDFNLNADRHPDANRDFVDVFGYPSANGNGQRHANGQRTSSFGNNQRQNEGDDMSAASQLVNMAHASPVRSHGQQPNTWSHLDSTSQMHAINSHGPLNDSTNRPSNSFYAPSMQAFNDFASQQQMQARSNVQSARSAGLVEPRHEPFRQQPPSQQHAQQHIQPPPPASSSLQLPALPTAIRPVDAAPTYRPIEPGEAVAFFNAIPRQTTSNGTAPSRAPVVFNFGSDNSFSMTGYRAPMNETEPRDKDGNLLGVALAARLSSREGPGEQDDDGRQFNRPSDRVHLNHMSFPITHSANSSPGGYNGISFAGPDGAHQQKMHPPAHSLKRRNTDIEFAHTSAFGEPLSGFHSRKRHHSIAQHPGAGHAIEGANMSHISQLPTIVDDGEPGFTPQFARPFQKSSKVNQEAQGPTTPVSQASDVAAASPPSQTAVMKKKSRDTKSRPNLTESQKRENHIISEQKRRNVIKQAFTDLNGLIPTLQGGKSGLSKAEVLKEVVTYLTSLVEGNKRMDAFLNGLNGGSGG